MKLDKNGYRSKRQDSFATAVKVLTFIFGVGVVVAAVCMYAIFSGCGGGGAGNGEPVYDENGVCTKNCNGNGDVSEPTADSYYPAGDSCNGDTCAAKPDTEAYVCPVNEPPKMCILYQDTYCAGFSLDGSLVACGGPEDTTNGQGCGCSMAYSPEQVNCKTDYECQLKPPDAWPPCVCWEFCEVANPGLYDCSGQYEKSFLNVTLSDEGGACKIGVENQYADSGFTYYYAKPGEKSPIDMSDCNSINGWDCYPAPSGSCCVCKTW